MAPKTCSPFSENLDCWVSFFPVLECVESQHYCPEEFFWDRPSLPSCPRLVRLWRADFMMPLFVSQWLEPPGNFSIFLCQRGPGSFPGASSKASLTAAQRR